MYLFNPHAAGVLSDSSVSENAGEMLVCATFTEPTNSGGSLQLVTSYIGSAKCKAS